MIKIFRFQIFRFSLDHLGKDANSREGALSQKGRVMSGRGENGEVGR